MLHFGCFCVWSCSCLNLLLQRQHCVTALCVVMLSELICSFLTFHLELVLTGPGSFTCSFTYVGEKTGKIMSHQI